MAISSTDFFGFSSTLASLTTSLVTVTVFSLSNTDAAFTVFTVVVAFGSETGFAAAGLAGATFGVSFTVLSETFLRIDLVFDRPF